MFYVYILRSKKDYKLYIGYSSNLKERFKKHNKGKVQATKYRRPLELIYYEAYKFEKNARNREKQLKYFGKAYKQLKNRIDKDSP